MCCFYSLSKPPIHNFLFEKTKPINRKLLHFPTELHLVHILDLSPVMMSKPSILLTKVNLSTWCLRSHPHLPVQGHRLIVLPSFSVSSSSLPAPPFHLLPSSPLLCSSQWTFAIRPRACSYFCYRKGFSWYYSPLHSPLQLPTLLYTETLWKHCLYLF